MQEPLGATQDVMAWLLSCERLKQVVLELWYARAGQLEYRVSDLMDSPDI